MADDGQRLMYEARLYSEQLRLLEGEIERIGMTAGDLNSSLASIEALKEDVVFMPIGGGALVNAKMVSTDVLVPIGGGYLMSMKKNEAVEEVKKRIKSTESALEKLRAEFERINAKLEEVGGKLDAMKGAEKR